MIAGMLAKFDEIDLTEDEKKQCALLNTGDGPIRLMPFSVVIKLREAYWAGIKTTKTKIKEKEDA